MVEKAFLFILGIFFLFLLFGCSSSDKVVGQNNPSSVLIPNTCSELKGNICNESENCNGEILSAIDTISCCSSNCSNKENVNNQKASSKTEAKANVDYNLTFNKVTINIKGIDYNSALLESILIFGDSQKINKLLVNNFEVNYDFNQYYSDAGYITSISPFVDSNIELEYSYDPDDLSAFGNYCIGDSCIIRLITDYIVPTKYTFTIGSKDYNLLDFSLDKNQIQPVLILAKGGVYEKEGFVLLKSQEDILVNSDFSLAKLKDLTNKTELFLMKPHKKSTLFFVPDGMIQAFYFNGSSILLLPAYSSNQANATFIHEYSHFLLNDSSFPMWIQEGIAEYVSAKVTYSKGKSWVNRGHSLLDWGVKEIPQEDIADLYGQAQSVFLYFDSKFGVEKTKALITEFESLPDKDVYSEEYLIKVESALEKVSGQDISIATFLDKNY